MKDLNWEGKMRPSEYERVRAWCNANGYYESDLSFKMSERGECYNKGLYNYIKQDKWKRIVTTIKALGGKFVDSNARFIYLNVEIKCWTELSTGCHDMIAITKNVTTFDEFIEFVGKVEVLTDLRSVFKI